MIRISLPNALLKRMAEKELTELRTWKVSDAGKELVEKTARKSMGFEKDRLHAVHLLLGKQRKQQARVPNMVFLAPWNAQRRQHAAPRQRLYNTKLGLKRNSSQVDRYLSSRACCVAIVKTEKSKSLSGFWAGKVEMIARMQGPKGAAFE